MNEEQIRRLAETGCFHKRSYKKRSKARAIARMSKTRFGVMREYRCPLCSRYHVGHPRPGMTRRELEE